MEKLQELQEGFLSILRAELSEWGINPQDITLSNTGRVEIEDHAIEFSTFVDKTSWSRIDMKIRAYTIDNGMLIFMPTRDKYEEYRGNDALEDEMEKIRLNANQKMNELVNAYFESVRELNEDKPLTERLIPAILGNYQLTDSLATVRNWKAKVILANSAGKDSPKIGEFDSVGYVHIGINLGNIIPIARADEHHRGYDLIEYLQEKGLIPQDTYQPFYIHSDYVDANDPIALQAMKTWRKLGGPNVVIKNWSNNSTPFQLTMDDYIKAEGNIQINKGSLFPLGQGMIDQFKLLSALCLEARQNERKEKQLYRQAIKTFEYYVKNLLMLVPNSAAEVITKIHEAESVGGEEGIKALEQLMFGFDSFKNKLHNSVRQALDPKGMRYNRADMEAIFGDLDLANHELGSL